MFRLAEPEKNVRFDPYLDLNLNISKYRLILQPSGSFMHANRGFAPHRGLLQSGAGRRRWLRSSVSSSDTQQKRWNRDDAQNGKNLRKFHKTTSRLESPPMRFAMGFKSILKKHSYFYAHISFPKLTNNSKTRKEQGRRNFPPFRDRSHPSLIVCSKLTVLGLPMDVSIDGRRTLFHFFYTWNQ